MVLTVPEPNAFDDRAVWLFVGAMFQVRGERYFGLFLPGARATQRSELATVHRSASADAAASNELGQSAPDATAVLPAIGQSHRVPEPSCD